MRTKNRLLASVACLLMVVFCGIGLTACDESIICLHEWGEYTIIENSTCLKEGVQERKCTKCEKVESAPLEKLEHVANVDDGDCTTPVTCFLCGEIVTEAKEHVSGGATCKQRAKCLVCNKEYGELAAHVPGDDDGDCTTPITCSVCGGEVSSITATLPVVSVDNGYVKASTVGVLSTWNYIIGDDPGRI